MSIYLDVPYVSQLNYGGGMNDPTGCWYASACMVSFYFEAGPRLGVPEIYGPGGHAATGSTDAQKMLETAKLRKWVLELFGKESGVRDDVSLDTDEHELLAKREHLKPVPNCATAHKYTLAQLEKYLRDWGPVFFYWTKTAGGSSYGHACVIIGTDDKAKQIIYHDPENAPNSRMSIDDFNAKRQSWKYALMRKDR